MSPSPKDSCPPIEDPGVILNRVVDSVTRNRMFFPGDRILVGLSGGPDSTVLLHLLHRLAPVWNIDLGAAHLNHMLRPEAGRDAELAAATADALGLPFYLKEDDVADYCKRHRLSIEDGGRRRRYQFFSELGADHGYHKVAVGHHGNDNAEQVLMNMIRGAGPSGLSGIPPVHEDWVVRPLIDLRKEDILGYIERHGLTCIDDPTNRDRRFLRNRIRWDVIPLLEDQANPRIVDALRRTASVMRDENHWIDGLVSEAYDRIAVSSTADRQVFSIEAFNQCELPMRRRLVRRIIRQLKGDLLRIRQSHIDEVVSLMESRDGSSTIHLPDRIYAERRYGEGLLAQGSGPLREQRERRDTDFPVYRHLIDAPDSKPGGSNTRVIDTPVGSVAFTVMERMDVDEYRISGHHVAFFDMEMLDFPLVLRPFQEGDRIRPLGMQGSKTVARLLQDAKMPPEERRRVPVLVSGGNTLWVIGVRVGSHAAITADTRKVLKAEFILPIADS